MNQHTTPLTITIAALAALSASAFAGQPVKEASSVTGEKRNRNVFIREEFGVFDPFKFGSKLQYSDTFGLALIKWGGAQLYEQHRDMDIAGMDGKPNSKLEAKALEKLKKIGAKGGGNIITDYSKLGLGKTLGFEGDQGSAILVRLRNQMQYLNENASAATWNYLDDRNVNDSGMRIDAALMVDFYLEGLYNRKQWFSGPVESPYRFWIRTGAQINKNDLPGNQEVDQQKYFALLNFQANPDQNFSIIPGSKRLEINAPQIVQIGGLLERNELSGNESFQWILGWAPVLNIFPADEGSTLFGSEWLRKKFDGFGLNKRMYFGKAPTQTEDTETKVGKPAVSSSGSKAPDAPKEKKTIFTDPLEVNFAKRWYASIDPNFTLLGESDARGVVTALGKKVKGARSVADLEKLREEQFRWNTKALVGYDDGLLEFSYTVFGVHPVSDFGDASIGHEARVDFKLMKSKAYGPKDWKNLSAYVSYKRGEFEPTFVDIDQLTAGVSVKF